MNISGMKKLFLLSLISLLAIQSEAQFNYNFTDESIPVTGVTYGAVGGGHTSQLFNRDDVDAENIQPQMINFNYFAGAERIRWYTPHFGIGQQALMWNAGARYKGRIGPDESFPELDATTQLQYIKIPALFYWKSYNRWHPDRRIRLNTFFGPYVAMLTNAEESWRQTVPGTDQSFSYLLKSGVYTATDGDGNEVFNGNADESEPFKLVDYGFVMGAGAEVRLWRRTIIALTLRSDLGLAEVENKDFEVDGPNGTRYKFYKDVVGKFQPYANVTDPNFNFNRPETQNFSFGFQLCIRKYFGSN
jgi:hypothetical protein